MIYMIPEIMYLLAFYIFYKMCKYFLNHKIRISILSKFYNFFNGAIDKSHDVDAINEENFLKINHKNRRSFFTGDYFHKEEDGGFGTIRKLRTIEPVYIQYESNQGHFSKRKVEVFAIKTCEGSAYLYGFCHQKGEARTFYINNIKCLVDKNGNRFNHLQISDYIRSNLVPTINNEYNKKVVLNCLN